MSSRIGRYGMVLAAGLGQRMRPLTDTRPKPLIEVAGRPLIAYAIDALAAAGCGTAVVNVHYLARQIEDWCARITQPRIVISDERAELLETGGGIAKALPLLGDHPFFILNGDGFWIEDRKAKPALTRLREAWDDKSMDCLLLLSALSDTTGYDGAGDFVITAGGRLARAASAAGGVPRFAYIGGYLVHPRLFEDAPAGRFSMNALWDRAISQGRLMGLVHSGHWFHVGTPAAIAEAETGLLRLDHAR